MIEAIRKKISQEEFDYQTLLDCLKEYARPRDKISDLLKKRAIIRVKKGLYILGRNTDGNLIRGRSWPILSMGRPTYLWIMPCSTMV